MARGTVMLEIVGKVGTHSTAVYRLWFREKALPAAGDRLLVMSEHDMRCAQPREVIIDTVGVLGDSLYYHMSFV